MKLYFFLFICFFLLSGFALHTQRYAKKHFTCFYYNCEVQEQLQNSLSVLDNYVQINQDPKLSKINALIVHGVYNKLTGLLSDSLEIYVLPPNSLTNKAKYNEFGYPEITIQKAIRLSDTKFFFKVNSKLENDLFDDSGKRYPEGTFKPQLKIIFEIFSKEGYDPVHVVEGFAELPEPLILEKSFIGGMEFASPDIKEEIGKSSLKNLIDIASNQVLFNLKNTKPKKL